MIAIFNLLFRSAYTRHNESVEMKTKASNGDMTHPKENNIGIAMKNGMYHQIHSYLYKKIRNK